MLLTRHGSRDNRPGAGSTSGSTDAWTGGVETGVRAWPGDARADPSRPRRGGAGRRPRVGGPQDPARPADRPGPHPQGARRQAGLQAGARRRSRPGCSTGSRRSGWSTTAPSPAPGSTSASRPTARGWPAGRWPRSCAARASTTRSPARRSTRSTRTPRRRPPARWSAASCARCAGSTTPPPPGGWSACWPARATPPGSPSRSSVTSWHAAAGPTRRLPPDAARHRCRGSTLVVHDRGRELPGCPGGRVVGGRGPPYLREPARRAGAAGPVRRGQAVRRRPRHPGRDPGDDPR